MVDDDAFGNQINICSVYKQPQDRFPEKTGQMPPGCFFFVFSILPAYQKML
jgi:hypothetical protein